MADLPDCDELFLRYFDRWYSQGDRDRKGFSATRPDLLECDDLIGLSEAEASPLTPDGQNESRRRIAIMLDAVRGDWPTYLDVEGDVDLEWIDAFDRYFDEQRIARVLERSDSAEFNNDYLVVCCEFGAALGTVMKDLQPRLLWRYEWPYWESTLLDPRSGSLIPVFHWAIKKMSSYGWDDGFRAKVRCCLELLDQDT